MPRPMMVPDANTANAMSTVGTTMMMTLDPALGPTTLGPVVGAACVLLL